MKGSESGQGVFDIERIKNLVELMKEHDLKEIDLKQEGQQIRLCRNVEEAAPRMMMAAPMQPPPPLPSVGGGASAPAAADDKSVVVIKSPMVGTFYARPNPNSEPFVRVGDQIEADKVICIIEAMKVFNEIPAEVRGRVVAVLVEDGEPVEFGKPLFKVDTGK
jgi:acetyl-CoA carboxylase biotin carboxyl carrier protein